MSVLALPWQLHSLVSWSQPDSCLPNSTFLSPCTPRWPTQHTVWHYAFSQGQVTCITLAAWISLVPRPSTPNAVEGLVKLLCRMMSGGRLEAWHFWWTAMLCMHGAISHTSRCPPDIILRRSLTRPSTALGDRRPGNDAKHESLSAGWVWLARLSLAHHR